MKFLATMCLCLAALGMTSCGRGVMFPHYYTLDVPPAPGRMACAPRIPGTVVIYRFQTPSYLRQGRIVYRESPEEIGFYDYHRWAADPADAVTRAMIDALRSSELFSFVKPYDGHNQEDYLMVGRLERLEEIDYGGRVRVEAKISAELVNARTGATEWTGNAPETVAIESRNLNSVVSAMDLALQKSIAALVASMDQRFIAN